MLQLSNYVFILMNLRSKPILRRYYFARETSRVRYGVSTHSAKNLNLLKKDSKISAFLAIFFDIFKRVIQNISRPILLDHYMFPFFLKERAQSKSCSEISKSSVPPVCYPVATLFPS